MPDGRAVEVYTLSNTHLRAEILTYGAALDRLFVPDRNGSMENILLTFGSLEDRIAGSQYQGEIVGRYANRIAGGRFTFNGQEFHVTPNEKNGNCLHGGGEFSHAVWQVNHCEDTQIELCYTSPAGAHGFPGEVTATVRYILAGSGLVVEYRAVSDADTVLNLTNHAYFNLGGAPYGLCGHAPYGLLGQGSILDHILQIDAEHYLPVDENCIPTGELRPVAGTAFDFRAPRPIGQEYDHNFCNPKGINVYEPVSGRCMTVETDLPGVQLYTGIFLPAPNTAFCLETQAWPDSPNQWPEQCLLRAGETYRTQTSFEFSVK